MFRPIQVAGCGLVSPGPGEQQEQAGTTARAKQAWRQGSDQWSSTGSRASSRPGSGQSRPQSSTVRAAQASPELGSLHQLSVTSRRAAFRSQVKQQILYHCTNNEWPEMVHQLRGRVGESGSRPARPSPAQPASQPGAGQRLPGKPGQCWLHRPPHAAGALHTSTCTRTCTSVIRGTTSRRRGGSWQAS